MVKNVTRYFSITGLVFVVFGVISFIIDILLGKGTRLSAYPITNFAIGFVLLITYAVFHADLVKRMITERSSRYGLAAIAYILLFVGIIVFINVILVVDPTFNKQKDFTENKVYSFSDQTQKICRSLKNEVKIIGFYAVAAGERAVLKDILERYKLLSKHIVVEIKDADDYPELARAEEVRNGMMLFASENKKTKINELTENAITNALIQVSKTAAKKVYFLSGHDEGSLDNEEENGFSILKKFLNNEGYEVAQLDLSKESSVPRDCVVLVVLGPQEKLATGEATHLEQYLNEGGHAIFLMDPKFSFDRTEIVDLGFDAVLKKWGVELEKDVIMRLEVMSIMGKEISREIYPMAVVADYEYHPITSEYNLRSTFEYARSLKTNKGGVEGLEVTAIINTIENAFWGETNISSISNNQMTEEDSDIRGSLTVAAAVTKPTAEAIAGKRNDETRLIVFGDSDFVKNGIVQRTGHLNLVLNSVNWLTGEEEKISIRPKLIRASEIEWTEEEASHTFYMSVLILPQFILLLGLIVWRRRKYR